MKPEFVKINDVKYKINTDFRVALEVNEIAQDTSIGDYERSLAVIYKLFGDKGINDKHNHGRLLELAFKYLKKGIEEEVASDEPITMDFKEDYSYIHASFMSDYKIDLDKEEMHFWTFLDLLNGLKEDCVLNRIRYIRDFDLSEVDNPKERSRIAKLKEQYALKRNKPRLTEEQQAIIDKYKKLANQK